MVVKALRPPVVHHHAEIEVVGVDHLLVAVAVGIGADPLFHAFAAANRLFHARAEGNRRGAGRAAKAFLHPGRDRIQSPGVGFQRVAAQRGGGVGVKQRVVAAADLPQLRQRLQHGGRGIALHRQQQARTNTFDGILHLVRGEHFAPRHFNGMHFRPAAAGDFAQQMAKAAKYRYQHLVARPNSRNQDRLNPGP